MAKSKFRGELKELSNLLTVMVLLILPGVISYYICRDYKGRGNSPENAPMAAVVVAFVWLPFYFGVRSLFAEHKWKFDLFLLVVFLFVLVQVTLNNPKF